MTRVAKLFELNREGLNVQRGLMFVGVPLVPGVILGALGEQQYLLSAAFGGLLVGLSDPGGEFGFRARRMVAVAVLGALLTALGFGIGDGAWEIVVLAAFGVTLLAGLTVKLGRNRFASAVLLNTWFIVAIGLPIAYKLDGIKTTAGAQTLAWLAGSAVPRSPSPVPYGSRMGGNGVPRRSPTSPGTSPRSHSLGRSCCSR